MSEYSVGQLLATALTLSRGGFVAVGVATLAVPIAFPMLHGV